MSVTDTSSPPRTSWVDALASLMQRVVPDAITTSILMLVALAVLSLALGSSVTDTIDAYYRGLWMLLQFTMQMTLVLVLSLVLGATPVFKTIIISLSRIPRTTTQVVSLAILCAAVVAYLNWGLSIALSPVIAIHFAREAERKGIAVDFLFLMAALAGAGAIWQFGFSGSAPLLMATPGNFLEREAGVMPLATTIWSPAALILVVSFILATIAVSVTLMPKDVRPVSAFPDATRLVAPDAAPAVDAGASAERPRAALTVAERLEQSRLTMVPLAAALSAWIYHHFFVKNLSLDINSVNTIVLLLGVVLHGSVRSYTRALQQAVSLCWPIVLIYHLYAGIAGLIQFTPVGGFFVRLFDPILTAYTYPLLITVVSTIVAIFIPTSGGQWAIQGAVTVEAASLVGVSAQRGLLALSVGDHMGNLITPFWAVVGAGIARVDFRLMFGYRLIFAALWFVMGVLAFTFLPC
ncbi:MAG TPA: TIGR00366 family protein [Vicinamibacterales bacterium]|jgi:short-chain fatty acids transporter|nr:TIGR00366 family protein [Vicinamibacterales bacterium]